MVFKIINKSFHYQNKTKLELFADSCLRPARFLLNGKEVILVEKLEKEQDFTEFYFQERPSFKDKPIWKTALAIVALLPGLVIGVTAKLLNMKFSKAAQNIYQDYEHALKENRVVQGVLYKDVPVVELLDGTGRGPLNKELMRYLRERYDKTTEFKLIRYFTGVRLETDSETQKHVYVMMPLGSSGADIIFNLEGTYGCEGNAYCQKDNIQKCTVVFLKNDNAPKNELRLIKRRKCQVDLKNYLVEGTYLGL